MKCTHPDHVDGQSCEGGAVGCSILCRCCCPSDDYNKMQRFRGILVLAKETINGLADQQAMTDNFYQPTLEEIDIAIKEIDDAHYPLY